MDKQQKVLSSYWNASNDIRRKLYNYWYESDSKATFKQFQKQKKGQQLLREYVESYINKSGVEVELLEVMIKNDDLLLVVSTDNKYIANELSFKCNSNVIFLDDTYKYWELVG